MQHLVGQYQPIGSDDARDRRAFNRVFENFVQPRSRILSAVRRGGAKNSRLC